MAESNGKVKESKKITELNLDNCRKDNILSIAEEHPALETLSLINVGLSSLKGFPKLENLKKLYLSDNRVSDGLNYLVNCPKLQNLELSGNKIKELETLDALQKLQLTTLDLFNNEVTQVENYREKIFKMLPSLKYLDGIDSNNVAAPSEDEDEEELNGNDSDEEDSEDDLEEYDDEDEDSAEEEDVSLAEIYNEDLDEDNSDWEESEGAEDDDDEIESEDEEGEANKSAIKSPSAAAKTGEKKAAEPTDSQPPGKKRKVTE